MASTDTIKALCRVIEHEVPTAIDQVTLDLERARMEREDFRQGNAPIWILKHALNNISYNKLRKYMLEEVSDLRTTLGRIRILIDGEQRKAKRRKRYYDHVIGRAIDSDEE